LTRSSTFAFGAEFWNAERLVHHFGRDGKFVHLPSAMRRACFRINVAISRSRLRTRLSRVAVDNLAQAVIGEFDLRAHLQPVSDACFGTRYLLAM